MRDRKVLSIGTKDEWSALADFLANAIAKYAAVLDIGGLDMPETMQPASCNNRQDDVEDLLAA